MSFTYREWWGLIHGMGFGALFLVAFAGGMAGLYSLRPALLTNAGVAERMRRLKIGVIGMAVVAWLTVISGTWVVYPWYREETPNSAKSKLLADSSTADWHDFGMEWKEHIAWFAPILATVVAYLVIRYAPELAKNSQLRRRVIVLFVISFVSAGIAGLFGALITKAAPVL